MANLNKVMLIGRLTRDPEVRTFANGGKVAKFGFAVNNRKKNTSTGQWEDEPVYVDVDVFNRGEQGRQADLVEQSLRKGHQVFIEGRLKLDQWTGQDGQKRSRLHVVAENFQFLERRDEGTGGYSRPPSAPGRSQPVSSSHSDNDYDAPPEPDFTPPPTSQPHEDIPF
jgi:single-strand DNA-binding protein